MLCTVSKDFREAAEGDGLWQSSYMDRFHKKASTLTPSPEGDGDGDEDGDVDSVTATYGDGDKRSGGFKNLYKRRLQDPHVSAWMDMEKRRAYSTVYFCTIMSVKHLSLGVVRLVTLCFFLKVQYREHPTIGFARFGLTNVFDNV